MELVKQDATDVVQAVPVATPVGEEDITTVSGLFIKQKLELLEVITGFETQNKYKVCSLDGDAATGTKGREMFKALEGSECCERQCCGPARGFVMNIFTKSTKDQYLRFERPFACECACACRSLMAVKKPDGTTLGEVFHPFFCCRDNFLVRAPNSGELWYTVTAGHCLSQPGLYCRCPCKTCMEIEFNIFEGDTDKVVGKIYSRFPGCTKALCTDTNNYTLTFPEGSDFAKRASLLATVFLIDFCFFEGSDNGEN